MPILAGETADIAVYVELDGALDIGTVTAALDEVAARFGPTRHTSGPRVTVDPVDLTDLEQPRDAALRWMEAFSRPAGASDITAHLITLGPDHQILHLVGPPNCADGLAGSTLVEHLAATYSARRGGYAAARHRGTSVRRAGHTDATRTVSPATSDFWDDELEPLPVPVRLSDRRAPASRATLTQSRTMSPSASDDLRAAADRCGVRIESIVVAALTGYLGAICRSDEVVIGLPTLIWSDTADAPVSTTVPLRLSTAPGRTVAEVVASAQARMVDTRAHSQSWLVHPRHDWFTADAVGPVPVVNVIPFLGPVRFGAVAGDVFVLSGGPVDDLRVNVYDALHDRVRVDVEAHPGLYTRAELHAHHDRFLDYLTRFVAASPTTLLAGVDVISVAEHIEVVDVWNATDELMPPATLADLIEMGMSRDHDRPTLAEEPGVVAEALTHGELDCRVNQLARVLLWHGVGPESVVGVMTANRISGITAMLAVLRTGGAVVPLDPTHSAAVVAHRIESARPICVVTDRVLTDAVLDPDDAARSTAPTTATGYDAIPPWVESIPLDSAFLDEVSDDPLCTTELCSPSHLGNPAWIAFGGAGDAAGVVLTHGAIANRLQWLQANRPLDADESVRVDISAGADWLWESLLPLTIGATVEMASDAVDGGASAGPAEVAHGVLHHRDSDDGHRVDGTARVAGRPVWNSAVYVLDARLRPLPVGVAGELYIAGDQLARGYSEDPGATADRFVANPFAPGRRMFRTGTEARWRADGVIEYIESVRVPVAAATTPPLPAPRTLADIVSATASVAPDAIAAIVDEGPDVAARSITYRELDHQSNQWARLLIACDIGPEDIVAVALPNGIDALIAIWSIAKSGAAFVTVDPGAADDSGVTDALVTQVIADSHVRFGFASAASGDAMMSAHGDVRWMSMDAHGYRNVVACLSIRPIRPASRHARLDVDHLAYVAYNAADGAPARGVAVANRGLSVFADEQRVRCGVERHSRTLHATSGGDLISILEVLLATSVGATMVIASGRAGVSADDVARVMRTHAVTHAFLDAPILEAMPSDDLPDLRAVVTGRVHGTSALVERWTAPQRVVLSGYGHADSTAGLVVLNQDLRPVPAGSPGELYLTGPALARGFLGSAALTATRFVANPWHRGTDRAGSVLYRTGDIVTLGPDGRVTYLGRSDSFA